MNIISGSSSASRDIKNLADTENEVYAVADGTAIDRMVEFLPAAEQQDAAPTQEKDARPKEEERPRGPNFCGLVDSFELDPQLFAKKENQPIQTNNVIEKVYTAGRQAIVAVVNLLKENKNIPLEDLVERVHKNVTVGATTLSCARVNDFSGARIIRDNGGAVLEIPETDYNLNMELRRDGKSYALTRESLLTDENMEKELATSLRKGDRVGIPLKEGDNIVLNNGVSLNYRDLKGMENGMNFLEVVSVGDSKVCLLRDKRLEQLTKDNLWVIDEELNDKKLSQVLGPNYDREINSDYHIVPLKEGDVVLLASTDIDTYDKSVKRILRKEPQKAADALTKRYRSSSAVVVGIGSRKGNSSLFKTAAYAGLGLFATAALAVGGWYLHYKISNKPAPQKPGIEASLGQAAQQEEDAVFSMIEKGIYNSLDGQKAPKVQKQEKSEGEIKPPFEDLFAEIVKITDSREWYTNRADPSKPDKDELELKIIGNAWNIAGMKSIDRNNAYLRITTKDNKVYAVKFSDSAAEGHIKNNKPAEDVRWAEVVEPAKDKQGNFFLMVYATYDESQSKTKQASLDLDHLLDSYSKATLRSSEEVKKDMRGFESHVNEIARHYATHGLEDTLATYAMPDDNPEMLKSILKYAWGELGVRRKTSIKSLTVPELVAITEAYRSRTNKEALKIIEQETGMRMSETSMYSALRKYEDMTGERVGKTSKKA